MFYFLSFPVTIGYYYGGSGTQRKIQLVVNGAIVKETNMNDDSTNAPISVLYAAEIEIQYSDSIIQTPSVTPVTPTVET